MTLLQPSLTKGFGYSPDRLARSHSCPTFPSDDDRLSSPLSSSLHPYIVSPQFRRLTAIANQFPESAHAIFNARALDIASYVDKELQPAIELKKLPSSTLLSLIQTTFDRVIALEKERGSSTHLMGAIKLQLTQLQKQLQLDHT